MTQNEFFNILIDGLNDFPEIELQEIIQYYKNKFNEGLSTGKTTDEIIDSLGDPNILIENLKSHKSNLNSLNDSNNISVIDKTTADNYIPVSYDSSRKEKETISNTTFDKSNSSHIVNTILKICIIILGLIIFFPLITSIIGIMLGASGIVISILLGSIGLLIGSIFTNFIDLSNFPLFITNFPHSSMILFAFGSFTLSLLLIFLIYYLCKFLFRLIKTVCNNLKGGVL